MPETAAEAWDHVVIGAGTAGCLPHGPRRDAVLDPRLRVRPP